MTKILFLIHDLGQGGAEKVLVNLVNNLDRDKFDITVISLFGGGVNEQFLKEDVRYLTVFKHSFPGNSRLMKLAGPKQLHRWFIKDRYDIEVSYLEGPSARIISGCEDPETKLVSWIHVEQHEPDVADKAYRNHAEALQCYKRFHHTVCVSEFVKQDFLSLYEGVENVSVLYNTNETDEILEKQHEAVEEGVFRDGEIRLCGVGKIMPIKGFDKLARIHKKLREECFPVHTYLLGSGLEQEKLRRYVEENGLQDSFTFLGYQTNPYKFVSKCDLFLCTSSAEGFSTAATEALILGVPVVTTPVSGMKEMLGEHNEYGIVTEGNEESMYQAVKRLLSDSALLQEYKEKAALRGKDFSKEQTVKAVEDLFLSLHAEAES